ncbi:MAG: DUF4085 domain-containing protein [Clostridia bacterium]|nr:DUF4085 domain-containing protein [Clostridia bacterium]
MKRYCSKENYLQTASAIENGLEYQQPITKEDLAAMKDAERRVGWNEHFTLHDCKITAVTKQGNDLIIDFDNSQGYIRYNQIVFKDGSIVEQEYSLVGSFFLNHDLYFENGLFTFYCLIWSPESQEPAGLGYLTFTATGIELS